MRSSLEIQHRKSPNVLLRLSEIIFFCGAAINAVERTDAEGAAHRFDVSLPAREDLDFLKGKLREAGLKAREV